MAGRWYKDSEDHDSEGDGKEEGEQAREDEDEEGYEDEDEDEEMPEVEEVEPEHNYWKHLLGCCGEPRPFNEFGKQVKMVVRAGDSEFVTIHDYLWTLHP